MKVVQEVILSFDNSVSVAIRNEKAAAFVKHFHTNWGFSLEVKNIPECAGTYNQMIGDIGKYNKFVPPMSTLKVVFGGMEAEEVETNKKKQEETISEKIAKAME